jgi:hypothetical protein
MGCLFRVSGGVFRSRLVIRRSRVQSTPINLTIKKHVSCALSIFARYGPTDFRPNGPMLVLVTCWTANSQVFPASLTRVTSRFWRRVRYRVRAPRSNSFHSLQNPAPELVLAYYFFHFCRAIKLSQKTRPGYVTLALDCAPDGFPYIHWLRCFLPVSVTLNRSSPANQPRWNSSARLRPMSSAA